MGSESSKTQVSRTDVLIEIGRMGLKATAIIVAVSLLAIVVYGIGLFVEPALVNSGLELTGKGSDLHQPIVYGLGTTIVVLGTFAVMAIIWIEAKHKAESRVDTDD